MKVAILVRVSSKSARQDYDRQNTKKIQRKMSIFIK